MHYTRIYTGDDGHSRFEMVTVSVIDHGILGAVSHPMQAKTLLFRESKADYNWDFHNAPARQFIVLLDGEVEITSSLGDVRRFAGGDVLLVEDMAGFGIKTENIVQCIRKSISISF